MMFCLLMLAALAGYSSGFDDTDLEGIACIQVTVEDIDVSLKFYTEVLGGMWVPYFSSRHYQRTSVYQKMFQKEILEAEELGVDPEELGVPSIWSGGDHMFQWEFVLFDNILVWLVRFSDTYVNGNVFHRFDPNVGSAKTGYAHMSFWVSEIVNPYLIMEAIHSGQREIESPYVGAATVFEHASYEERDSERTSDFTIVLPPENNGFRFGATRGPGGEKIELSFYRGNAETEQFQGLCSAGTVHSAMLGQCSKLTNIHREPFVKTNGLHHISLTVRNAAESLAFYLSVIGGKQPVVTPYLQFAEPYRNLMLQDDYLAAVDANLNPNATFGFVELGQGREGAGTMDLTSMSFENLFLELKTINPADPADKLYLERSWSSPAYLNTVSPGFWVKNSVPLPTYIEKMEKLAEEKGFTGVKANRAVKVRTSGQNVTEENYMELPVIEGFDFTFAKGPSGEQICFVQFTGWAAKILEQAYKRYGGVSVAHDDLNPYKWGGYNNVCSSNMRK